MRGDAGCQVGTRRIVLQRVTEQAGTRLTPGVEVVISKQLDQLQDDQHLGQIHGSEVPGGLLNIIWAM